jgi:NADH:ubiquinone oxidoreductase subunit H
MWAELAVTAIKLVVAGVALLSSVVVMVWVERRGAAFIQERLGPNRVGPLGLAQVVTPSSSSSRKMSRQRRSTKASTSLRR